MQSLFTIHVNLHELHKEIYIMVDEFALEDFVQILQ